MDRLHRRGDARPGALRRRAQCCGASVDGTLLTPRHWCTDARAARPQRAEHRGSPPRARVLRPLEPGRGVPHARRVRSLVQPLGLSCRGDSRRLILANGDRSLGSADAAKAGAPDHFQIKKPEFLIGGNPRRAGGAKDRRPYDKASVHFGAKRAEKVPTPCHRGRYLRPRPAPPKFPRSATRDS